VRLRDIFAVYSRDNSSERYYLFMVAYRDIITYCVIAIAVDIVYTCDFDMSYDS